MLDPKITKITEQQIIGPNNQPLTVMRVEYTVGKHGPFFDNVPKGEFDAAKIQTVLRAFAANLSQLTGE